MLVFMQNFLQPDQSQYTGTMLRKQDGSNECVKHGQGILVWPDGARYEGEFRNNKANGLGRFFHNNGDVYEGEFREDKANGEGTYKHCTGS